ncbi:MAG: RidA family protein [Sneathiella sp.]
MVRHISSGSTFEAEIGYSRAVVDDNYVFVSGTTGMDYAAMTMADGVLAQATQCLQNIQDVLEEAGSSLDKVVRVCYYLPDRNDFEACWPALRAAFDVAKPAATMIETRLMNDDMKIEIEVTAKR